MDKLYSGLASDPQARQYALPLAGALFGIQALRYLNSWASQRALNHFVTDSTWDWKKEIVVITGGASGIGAATARLLASKGVKVIVLDKNEPREKLASGVYFYSLDITDASAISSTCTRIRSEHGSPTVLINNAGIGSDDLILSIPMDDLRKIFETNLFSHYALVKEFLPEMVKHDHGHIVTVSSMAAFATRAGGVHYAATKAAALAWHDGIGLECALYYNAPRIRTTVVLPAFVATPMVERLRKTGKLKSSMIAPEDVAKQIVDQLYSGNSGQIFCPPKYGLVSGVRGFPHWLQQRIWMGFSAGIKEATLQNMGKHE